MSAAPHGMGEAARVYAVCQLFKAHPELHFQTITISESGRVDIAVEGASGVLRDWSRSMPAHVHTTRLVPTHYGSAEADVIESAGIVVTIRRPLAGPGVVA